MRCGAVRQRRYGEAGSGKVRFSKAGEVWHGVVRTGGVRQANFKEINMEVMTAEPMKEERKFLERLARNRGGMLQVDDVLDAAKNPMCILHKHFQWNDDKAAEAYRKMQARQLIQKCTVTIDKAPDVHIRAFVSLSSDQNHGGGYRMAVDVLSDDDLKAHLLYDMQMTIAKWKKQMNLLDKETAAIIDKLEDLVSSKAAKRKEVRV